MFLGNGFLTRLLIAAMFVAASAQAGEKVAYRLKWLRNVRH